MWFFLDTEVLITLVSSKVLHFWKYFCSVGEVRTWFVHLWFIKQCCQFLRLCSIE
jgi:hypothetical protein